MTIQAAATPAGTITLNWSALMGRSYQVQASGDLATTDWANLSTRVTATNTIMTATDLVGYGSDRFYRVVLSP